MKHKVWTKLIGRYDRNGPIPTPAPPLRRESSKYREDSDYSSKTSSSEEEDDDEAWENDNTTKKKAKKKPTRTKKTGKKSTAITDEQRIQFCQLDRPISIMVAWDKPKKYL